MRIIIDYGYGRYGCGLYWYDIKTHQVIRFEPDEPIKKEECQQVIIPGLSRLTNSLTKQL